MEPGGRVQTERATPQWSGTSQPRPSRAPTGSSTSDTIRRWLASGPSSQPTRAAPTSLTSHTHITTEALIRNCTSCFHVQICLYSNYYTTTCLKVFQNTVIKNHTINHFSKCCFIHYIGAIIDQGTLESSKQFL